MPSLSREQLRARAKANTESAKARDNSPERAENLTSQITKEVTEDKTLSPAFSAEKRESKEEKVEKAVKESTKTKPVKAENTTKKENKPIITDLDSIFPVKKKETRNTYSIYLEDSVNEAVVKLAQSKNITKSEVINIILKHSLGLE